MIMANTVNVRMDSRLRGNDKGRGNDRVLAVMANTVSGRMDSRPEVYSRCVIPEVLREQAGLRSFRGNDKGRVFGGMDSCPDVYRD